MATNSPAVLKIRKVPRLAGGGVNVGEMLKVGVKVGLTV
jgi:hypothetical protein